MNREFSIYTNFTLTFLSLSNHNFLSCLMINQPKNPYAKTDTPSTLINVVKTCSLLVLKKTYRIHLKEVRWKIWLIKYLVVVDLFKVNFPIQASWIQSTCANWTVFFIFFFITKMTCIIFLVNHKTTTNEIPCFDKLL